MNVPGPINLGDGTMSARDTNGREEPAEEVEVSPFSGEALPAALDTGTIEMVRRYVETERDRSRKVIVWSSTVILFFVLFVLMVFILVGILVLRNTRFATRIIDDVHARTTRVVSEMAGVSNRVSGLENTSIQIAGQIGKEASLRERESESLKYDLNRFSRWVVSSQKQKARALGEMEGKLREIEDTARIERAAFRDEYSRMLESFKGSVEAKFAAASPVSETPSTGEVSVEPAVPSPPAIDMENLSAAALEEAGVFAIDEPAAYVPHQGHREITVITFPSGDRYEGEVQAGLLHGWGVYYHRNGDRYEGEFREDMREGRGTLLYATGDKYVGNFHNDMRSGQGSMMFVNGDRYSGQFENDMMNGKGTLLQANMSKYSGDFRNGLKHGNGVFRFSNGDIYSGEFVNDQRQGQGTYVFTDGSKYIGSFQDGLRHGQGRYIYAAGGEYIGTFREGMKEGEGISLYPNGKRMKGLWKEDRFVRMLGEVTSL